MELCSICGLHEAKRVWICQGCDEEEEQCECREQ